MAASSCRVHFRFSHDQPVWPSVHRSSHISRVAWRCPHMLWTRSCAGRLKCPCGRLVVPCALSGLAGLRVYARPATDVAAGPSTVSRQPCCVALPAHAVDGPSPLIGSLRARAYAAPGGRCGLGPSIIPAWRVAGAGCARGLAAGWLASVALCPGQLWRRFAPSSGRRGRACVCGPADRAQPRRGPRCDPAAP